MTKFPCYLKLAPTVISPLVSKDDLKLKSCFITIFYRVEKRPYISYLPLHEDNRRMLLEPWEFKHKYPRIIIYRSPILFSPNTTSDRTGSTTCSCQCRNVTNNTRWAGNWREVDVWTLPDLGMSMSGPRENKDQTASNARHRER